MAIKNLKVTTYDVKSFKKDAEGNDTRKSEQIGEVKRILFRPYTEEVQESSGQSSPDKFETIAWEIDHAASQSEDLDGHEVVERIMNHVRIFVSAAVDEVNSSRTVRISRAGRTC